MDTHGDGAAFTLGEGKVSTKGLVDTEGDTVQELKGELHTETQLCWLVLLYWYNFKKYITS